MLKQLSKQVFLTTLILLSCVGCDQFSKQAANQWLFGAEPQSFLGDTFRLVYIENTGAFLGMGSQWPESVRWAMFTLLSTLMVAASAWWVGRQLWRNRSLSPFVPMFGAVLFVAGGVGNLIDRIGRQGAVIDFMNVGIGSLRTGIFNVADVQIMLGLALWMLWKPPSGHASGGPQEPSVATEQR